MSTPNAWFRRSRTPPELIFMAAVVLVALAGCLATSPPRPAVTASIAPICADSSFKPCRGQ